MQPTDSVVSVENPNSRVILSVPHDGMPLKEFQLFSARTKGTHVHDERTAKIVNDVNSGKPVAGVVRGLLPREVCDYNRAKEKAFEDPGVEMYYNLYHKKLAHQLREAVKRHKNATLLDMHSFWGDRRPTLDLILGSRDGKTTPDGLDQSTLAHFSAEGFAVEIDNVGGRYSGGFTVGAYGGENSSSLQIEISSSLLFDFPEKHSKLAASLRSLVLSLQ